MVKFYQIKCFFLSNNIVPTGAVSQTAAVIELIKFDIDVLFTSKLHTVVAFVIKETYRKG